MLIAVHRFLQHLLLAYLVWRWNRKKCVHIARPEFLSSSARVELQPDGYGVGGRITIGSGARISDGVVLAPYGGSIEIGCNVYIGPYAVLYGHGGLSIGDDVMIAAHTTIIPSNHGFSSLDEPIRKQRAVEVGITINDNVWIGSGVRVLDGVIIGRGSVVGAGSVVTKSLPENSISCGIPAKVIRSRAKATTGVR